MAMMLVQCPDTGKVISTGVDIDPFSFVNLGLSPLTVRKCPACGSTHVMSTKEAWLGEPPVLTYATRSSSELETEGELAG